MKKKILLITLAALLVSAICFAGPVKLYTSEWSPYVSRDIPGNGFAAEIISLALISMNVETELVFTSWDVCETKVKNGEAIAAFPHTPTDARKKFAEFSPPFAMSKTVFFYLKTNLRNFDYTGFKDIEKLKIGGVNGSSYVPLFKEKSLPVNYSSDVSFALQKLYLGTVDIVPENEFVGWGLIAKRFPKENYLFGSTKNALNKSSLHLMFSKKHAGSPELMKKFDTGLKYLLEKGIYKKTLKRYIDNVQIEMPTAIY